MTVHKENGDELKFIETKGGLYYYEVKPKTGIKNYSFATTLAQNRSLYTARRLKQADLAWRLYTMIGRPLHTFSIKIIRDNLLKNCPITTADDNIALSINGPNRDAIRGKKTKQATEHVQSNQRHRCHRKYCQHTNRLPYALTISSLMDLCFSS